MVVVAPIKVAGVAFRIFNQISLHEVAAIVVTPRRKHTIATTAIVRTPNCTPKICETITWCQLD